MFLPSSLMLMTWSRLTNKRRSGSTVLLLLLHFFFVFDCSAKRQSRPGTSLGWWRCLFRRQTPSFFDNQAHRFVKRDEPGTQNACGKASQSPVEKREESRVLSGLQYVSSNTFRNWRTTHSALSMSYSAAAAAAPSRELRIVVKVAGTLTASPPQNQRSVSILCLSGSSCISPPWASWGFCRMGYGLISRRVRFRARSRKLAILCGSFNRTIRTAVRTTIDSNETLLILPECRDIGQRPAKCQLDPYIVTLLLLS